MDLDYKSETKRAYDKYPEKFEESFIESFDNYIQKKADKFIKLLNGKKIVDLGSGPGNHAEYFHKKGLDILCVDISEEMVKLCRKKGLRAQIMDIENLQLSEKSYDGIWAHTSLLHIPKNKTQKVIDQIIKILKYKGLLSLSVKEGEGERFEIHKKYPDIKRWFTYFTEKEIKKLFGQYFSIIYFSRTKRENKHDFLNYVFQLKN